MSEEMKSQQASAVLLAALCIPSLPVKGDASASSNVSGTSRFDDSVMQEKMGRMATLLGFHTRNPTRDELGKALADLEGGIGCAITSSGMAALTLILHLLQPEDLLLAPYDCYGRSYWLLHALAEKKHFQLKFIDMYNPKAWDDAFKDHPKMVLIESPSNPLMRILFNR